MTQTDWASFNFRAGVQSEESVIEAARSLSQSLEKWHEHTRDFVTKRKRVMDQLRAVPPDGAVLPALAEELREVAERSYRYKKAINDLRKSLSAMDPFMEKLAAQCEKDAAYILSLRSEKSSFESHPTVSAQKKAIAAYLKAYRIVINELGALETAIDRQAQEKHGRDEVMVRAAAIFRREWEGRIKDKIDSLHSELERHMELHR